VLGITSAASEAIRGILAGESVPDGSIVRIASADEGLSLALVDGPEPDDQLVATEGAALAIEAATAALLDDKLLDAEMQDEEITFSLMDRADQS
jgi:Fe-S cluster assembly iron-binding protein IscA